MKILIVDDEPVSRGVLQKIVTQADDHQHQVTVAADATAAWSLLDDPARYFDVAFIDLSMPKVDGFQLFQRIRQSPLLAKLEVVVCTASKDRTDVAKAIQLGARHYLVKPVTEAVVQAKLRQIRPPEVAPLRGLVTSL
jgi:CheY-like chemotaxis protein